MTPSTRHLRDVVALNRAGCSAGLCSICSAHPTVLEAAMHEARRTDSVLCIESTANQVNQFGGYTGMAPAAFVQFVRDLAEKNGLPKEKILLGGDHLGPFPWRGEASSTALEKASTLVRAYVEAGYTKIHLDASMCCAGDPGAAGSALDGETATKRTALLCSAAESARASLPARADAPVYVIGTEVPAPGGEQSDTGKAPVTRAEDLERTLEDSRTAFFAAGLHDAWKRVVAVVVQPGAEFGDSTVADYDRGKAGTLKRFIEGVEGLVYEAHSTDHQTPDRLRELVEDHFAILKVGPWLTFAFREAVFALEAIEAELLPLHPGLRPSRMRQTLEDAMLRDAAHWRPYYAGDPGSSAFARKFGLSDRSRYYWPQPDVREALANLFSNLSSTGIPLSLLSQYFPGEYEAVRAGALKPVPQDLARDRIARVLRIYARACGP